MLTAPSARRGFSLIELMVVLVLVGICLTMTVRAFAGWSADARVRTTAESLVNALRVAQANAIAHNRTVAFTLATGEPVVGAAPSGSGNTWYSALAPLPGSNEAAATLLEGATVARQYGVTLTGSPDLAGTSKSGSSAPLCFDAMGRLATENVATGGTALACTAPADGLPVVYQISAAGAARQFRVYVYPGGRARMCDAAKALSNNNPDGCP
jgi:type IV fimbrial biogenesis protein FimT